MTKKMLNARGRLFTYACYATAGAFVYGVFLSIMAAKSTGAAGVVPTLFTGISGIIGAALVAIGSKATAEGWQKGKQPSSEVTSTVKTSGLPLDTSHD